MHAIQATDVHTALFFIGTVLRYRRSGQRAAGFDRWIRNNLQKRYALSVSLTAHEQIRLLSSAKKRIGQPQCASPETAGQSGADQQQRGIAS